MGYRIVYASDKRPRDRMKKMRTGILVALCAVLLLAGIEFSGLSGKIKSWLLPGDPAVTEAALDAMLLELKAGESVEDAVTAFCEEIVDNAQLPE